MRSHPHMLVLGLLFATAAAESVQAQPAAAEGQAGPAQAQPAAGTRKRRQPPPAVIPAAEATAAQKAYQAGNFNGAVTQAKAALNKNERYTPAMLIMAKAYYKLGKYEWVRTLWTMMQANNASDAEKSEMFQILSFMEKDKGNTPGAIEMLRKATDLRPENAVFWNNLGALYLEAKNYRDAVPALERAVQLQPVYARAYVNLGSAYRGLKQYQRAQGSYERALQLYPNYADAVFHLGILYLDADQIPNMDATAKFNTAIGHLQKYRQMMVSAGQLGRTDPVDTYLAEAQEGIRKEQKRLERLQKQQERERQRGAQKGAAPADAPAPATPSAAQQ